MGMGNGAGQCVGGVGTGFGIQAEQATNHVLHLGFVGMAVTDDGLFDLQGGVFGNVESIGDQSANGGTPRLTKEKRGLRVDVYENDFHRRLLGGVAGSQLANAVVD